MSVGRVRFGVWIGAFVSDSLSRQLPRGIGLWGVGAAGPAGAGCVDEGEFGGLDAAAGVGDRGGAPSWDA
jgi:hypothetical protein